MMATPFDFSTKTAIIVGGTKGIGLEVAKQFQQSGANTFIAGREKPEDSDAGSFIQCDARDEAQVERLIEKVIASTGQIDILVNSLAINFCKLIEDIPLAEWQSVLDTNITAIFLTCKAVLSHMKSRKYGRIVNISSIAGRHRSPVSGVHYVASKSAIIGFSRQLAFEAAPFGVHVNVLCPSQTLTAMLKNSMTAEQIEKLEAAIPVRRLATVQEQAGPILFLCSDQAAYMTGALIDVNGGQI